MALLKILHFPDSRLRTKAKPVKEVDAKIQNIITDMFETMYMAPGIGLAATQVNIHQRIIVIDVSENKNQPLCLINPNIISVDGQQSTEEGCLSVPGVFEQVQRAENITVQALDKNGKQLTLTADEILSVCIQHEIDHLNGKLFVDRISSLKRQRIRQKLIKQQRNI
ncbi:peptide deformylase [Candidatus Halobeggiatoa sp. HSG11]|nr:peptide deformylase [Candidatus Halobeggiatoa sp. HSG11]